MVSLAAQPHQVWTFDRLDQLAGHPVRLQGHPRVIDSTVGKAVHFNGVDDAMFVDVHPLAGAGSFTWEVLFRPDHDGAPEQRFFHLQEEGTANRMLFEIRIVDGQWFLDSFVNSGAASKALMNRQRLHPLDRWYRVAMVYDGREFRNYVDGVLEGSAEIQFAPQRDGRTSAGVRINLKDYFKGAIRSARFTHKALQPAEFAALPSQ